MVKKQWLNRAADWLNLPEDLITDLPRIEWVAIKTVKIENHKGLMHYASSSIKFYVKSGVITIAGEHLMVSSLTNEYASVSGDIKEILFNGQHDD
ncbi:YabP/YqfC family sporulation protein [Jeotgalibacillus salarius]|nr:YabP/YqfC family sporulation protein [Jeotgalibacillus salarius]